MHQYQQKRRNVVSNYTHIYLQIVCLYVCAEDHHTADIQLAGGDPNLSSLFYSKKGDNLSKAKWNSLFKTLLSTKKYLIYINLLISQFLPFSCKDEYVCTNSLAAS